MECASGALFTTGPRVCPEQAGIIITQNPEMQTVRIDGAK